MKDKKGKDTLKLKISRKIRMNHGNSLLTVKVKVAQSSPALCNPMDYAGYGILQARILEWIVIPFSRGSSQPLD